MRYLLLLLFVISKSYATSTLSLGCTHVQVCNLINELFPGSSRSELLIHTLGDPHHFHPEISHLKAIVKAPFLVTAPLTLQPWLKSLLKERNQNKDKRTIVLTSISKEGHFWLDPQETCNTLKELEKKLLSFQYRPLLSAEESCQKAKKFEQQLLDLKSKLSNDLLILDHDAFSPVLKRLNIAHFALKNVDHHGEVSIQTLKDLNKQLKEFRERPTDRGKVIWVNEEIIETPKAALTKFKLKNDVTIVINPEGKEGSPFQVIQDFITKLQQGSPFK